MAQGRRRNAPFTLAAWRARVAGAYWRQLIEWTFSGRSAIRDLMPPDQHRSLSHASPFMVYGAVDAHVSSLGPACLKVNWASPIHLNRDLPSRSSACLPAGDPAQLSAGCGDLVCWHCSYNCRRAIASMGISSRFDRAAGFAAQWISPGGIRPQYIQLRQYQTCPLEDPATRPAQLFNELDDAAKSHDC